MERIEALELVKESAVVPPWKPRVVLISLFEEAFPDSRDMWPPWMRVEIKKGELIPELTGFVLHRIEELGVIRLFPPNTPPGA